MHKWLISVCFFLLNLNFVSPTSVKTPPFDLKQYHPPSAPGSCSCVQSDNQFVKKFKFDQYSSCGFQSGDPWPYCIVDVKGDCPSKFQTSIPNVFYIPCERHHVDMTETCTDCETCAPQDHSGKFQVLTRTYGVNDSACASLCLHEQRCTFSSFSAGECSLFSNCTDRDFRTIATSLRKKIVVVTNHTQDGIPDATPKDFRYEEGVGLHDCLCRNEWVNPQDWEQCGQQRACASDSCLGGNWCQVANPPCKSQFTFLTSEAVAPRNKIAWAKCSNETQVEPTNICKCKAKWSLPDKLGKDCVDQRGCSFSKQCRARGGFGMCDFEEDGCTWPSAPMPCGKQTPAATPAPEDAEECKCKEKWEYIGVDPHCVNQHGCATMDCLGGNWCIVENIGCRTQISEFQPFAYCNSEKAEKLDECPKTCTNDRIDDGVCDKADCKYCHGQNGDADFYNAKGVFDGNDCCDDRCRRDWVGDGDCDNDSSFFKFSCMNCDFFYDSNGVFDAGDCCPSTCITNEKRGLEGLHKLNDDDEVYEHVPHLFEFRIRFEADFEFIRGHESA